MARKLASDRVLFAAFVALALFGCVMVYSASAPEAVRLGTSPFRFLSRQVAALLVGAGAGYALFRLDLASLRRPAAAYGIFASCLALCAAALFFPAVRATHRWIRVGPATLQPAELMKVALVVLLAYQLDRKRDQLAEFGRGLAPSLILVALASALVVLEPDLGTGLTLLAVAGALFFLAGVPLRFFAIGVASAVPLVTLLVLSASYRKQRVLAFLHPGADPLGKGFQAAQSLIAVGTGGFLGNGLGESRQKLFFLPYPHTDFIFAIVGEELGFLGALSVLALFAVVAWRGLRAVRRAPAPHLAYLAAGATAMIVLQAAINLGVVLTILPTKGIPLPFVSYGGSALVADCLAAGLLLNVSQHAA